MQNFRGGYVISFFCIDFIRIGSRFSVEYGLINTNASGSCVSPWCKYISHIYKKYVTFLFILMDVKLKIYIQILSSRRSYSFTPAPTDVIINDQIKLFFSHFFYKQITLNKSYG